MEVVRRWSWVFGFAGALLVGAGGVAWWLLGSVDGVATGFFASGVFGIVGWLGLDRARVLEAARSRAFAYDVGSGLLQSLALLIAVVAFNLADRHDTTWDLTRDREHTLASQSVTVLSQLSEPVELKAFFRKGSPGQFAFEGLARRLADASPLLTVTWVDPLAQPLEAQRHEVASEAGTVVLIQGDRTQRLEGEIREDELIQKLVLVQSTQDHRICWVQGHGEADPDDEYDRDGLGAIVVALEGFNYQVTKAFPATEGIDRGCEALIVARPTTDWLPFEREALAAYLAEGGRVLALLDPGLAPGFSADLERFGILVGEDVVFDVDPRNTMLGVAEPSFPVLSGQSIVHHAITRDLGAAVVLGIARSVTAVPDAQGIVVQELLRTSEQAWAETNLEADPNPDEGTDRIGEIPLAAVAEIADPSGIRVVRRAEPAGEGSPALDPFDPLADLGRAVPEDFTPKAGGRLVVVGDANFVSNGLLELGNNRDLFLNAVAWLVDEQSQIGERPAVAETLEITALGSGLMCVASVVGVPGLAALFALFTLLRRRFL